MKDQSRSNVRGFEEFMAGPEPSGTLEGPWVEAASQHPDEPGHESAQTLLLREGLSEDFLTHIEEKLNCQRVPILSQSEFFHDLLVHCQETGCFIADEEMVQNFEERFVKQVRKHEKEHFRRMYDNFLKHGRLMVEVAEGGIPSVETTLASFWRQSDVLSQLLGRFQASVDVAAIQKSLANGSVLVADPAKTNKAERRPYAQAAGTQTGGETSDDSNSSMLSQSAQETSNTKRKSWARATKTQTIGESSGSSSASTPLASTTRSGKAKQELPQSSVLEPSVPTSTDDTDRPEATTTTATPASISMAEKRGKSTTSREKKGRKPATSSSAIAAPPTRRSTRLSGTKIHQIENAVISGRIEKKASMIRRRTAI